MSARNLAALTFLGVPAIAYGGAVRLRNRFYDTAGVTRRAGIPVLSVGNLTVGGTGKTPIVAWIVRALAAQGYRPAVVSRGYGGTAGKGPLVVSDGSGPRVGFERCGDEPLLLARTLPGTLVVVGSDRLAGARAAHRAGANVVVLDDGFQHRSLARDLDIVLLDAHNPFGNYRLLPAGTLREPLAGLARASVVLITRARLGESMVVIERVVRRYNRSVPILRAGHRRVGFVDADGNPVPRPRRALAFCGVGNPASFAADVEACGFEVVDLRVFADHHRYGAVEVEEMVRLARRAEASLVTTEKDLLRVPGRFLRAKDAALVALRIEAEVHDLEELMRRVHAAIDGVAA